MKKIKSLISLLFVFFVLQTNAQTPDNYPPVNPDPVEFNLFNIILYIVLPLLLILGYLLYLRSRKKADKEKEAKESDN